MLYNPTRILRAHVSIARGLPNGRKLVSLQLAGKRSGNRWGIVNVQAEIDQSGNLHVQRQRDGCIGLLNTAEPDRAAIHREVLALIDGHDLASLVAAVGRKRAVAA